MPGDPEISNLVARARKGDKEAIREFLVRFEHEVRLMVRNRLPRRLRSQFDSMDFVQSVWKSFFSTLRSSSTDFKNIHHLRGFLAGVVRNKVYEQHRRLTRTEKHAINREVQLYVRRRGKEIDRALVASDPSPSDAVQASERLAQLTAGCTPRDAQVITLRHQGLTFREIGLRTGINERSVRRVIEEARSRMEARGWV
jgi:RNA polymerase sigma-70 factor (ECF subfamily)